MYLCALMGCIVACASVFCVALLAVLGVYCAMSSSTIVALFPLACLALFCMNLITPRLASWWKNLLGKSCVKACKLGIYFKASSRKIRTCAMNWTRKVRVGSKQWMRGYCPIVFCILALLLATIAVWCAGVRCAGPESIRRFFPEPESRFSGDVKIDCTRCNEAEIQCKGKFTLREDAH